MERFSLRSVLGRVSMYRVVTIVLLGLVVTALVLTATSRLDPSIFTLRAMAASLVVLLVTSVVANQVFGLAVGRRPHTESSIITGLLLWFLYWPTSDVGTLGWLALTAGFAQASKYVLAWRGRHVFNPAAAGVAAMVLVGEVLGERIANSPPATTWWVANEAMFWFVLVGAVLVLQRTGRLALGVAFALPAAVLTLWGASAFYPDASQSLGYAVYSTPIVFFAGFMLSEPLTLPPRRHQQVVLAVVAAAVFAWPLYSMQLVETPLVLGPFEGTFEIALLPVNAMAFGLGQRGGIRLRLLGSRPLGGDAQELSFAPLRRIRWRAGQHLELHLPHPSDIRGVRRVFTIASTPAAETVDIAMRVPSNCSSFKRALVALPPGTEVAATGVRGDFVWPRRDRPVLLVAGGIGVTPFLSQLRHDQGRDAVLVYGVSDAHDIPYRDELAGLRVRVVLVSSGTAPALPDGWSHVSSDALTADLVRETVPDHADRLGYVSGPPAMVSEVAAGLRRHGVRTRTDHFTGY